MGLLDSLHIGASSLRAHQAAIQVTGNNIANAATEGYTRQEAILEPLGSSRLSYTSSTGTGVELAGVRRMIDEALEQRLNNAYSQMQRYQVTDEAMARIESLMNELSDTDLSSAMTELFNGFSALGQSPTNSGARDTVLQQAQTVCERFHHIRNGIIDLQDELTDKLDNAVIEADRLAGEIAALNVKISDAESGERSAPSLRDQRDALVRRLSELVKITTKEDANGMLNVWIASQPLVSDGRSRGLTLIQAEVDGQLKRVVAFADNSTLATLHGGQITGLQATRDGEVAQVAERLDLLANQLIWQVNRLHSSGSPLDGFTRVTGTYGVEDATVALDSPDTNLRYAPANGSFLVKVISTGSDGTLSAQTTKIDVPLKGNPTDMTFNDLLAALNAVNGVTASTDASGKLTVQASAPGTTIGFAEDSSGVLAALGINTFFDGCAAYDIKVNPEVAANANRIAAGLTEAEGDGDNALAIAQLASQDIAALSGVSLTEYQQRLTSDVAVWTAGARDTATANEVVYEGLLAQRESISGVSLDEEAVNLLTYQRAFQGAARFITVVDELLQTLLAMT